MLVSNWERWRISGYSTLVSDMGSDAFGRWYCDTSSTSSTAGLHAAIYSPQGKKSCFFLLQQEGTTPRLAIYMTATYAHYVSIKYPICKSDRLRHPPHPNPRDLSPLEKEP